MDPKQKKMVSKIAKTRQERKKTKQNKTKQNKKKKTNRCIALLQLSKREGKVIVKSEEMLPSRRGNFDSLSTEIGTGKGGHQGITDSPDHVTQPGKGVRVFVYCKEAVAFQDCHFHIP